MYEWLLFRLLNETQRVYEANLKKGQDPFTAKNNCQVFYARNLSLAYIEVSIVFITILIFFIIKTIFLDY